MRFTIFWPCTGNASYCSPRILAEGEIEADTDDKFVKYLVGKDKAPYYLPSKSTVCFDSPGGNLMGAIKLGTIIREKGFDTCVEPEYRQSDSKSPDHTEEVFNKSAICASACVFSIVGGVNREIDQKARIGVHQFAGIEQAIGDGNTQITIVALAGYLEEMGVKRELLDIASLYPPNKLYWLSTEEISLFRIENQSIEFSRWQLSTTKEGVVFAHIKQAVPENHGQTGLILIKDSQTVKLLISFEPAKRTDKAIDLAISANDGNK
jgi:hypothetical protein